jgi:hypothetical protein
LWQPGQLHFATVPAGGLLLLGLQAPGSNGRQLAIEHPGRLAELVRVGVALEIGLLHSVAGGHLAILVGVPRLFASGRRGCFLGGFPAAVRWNGILARWNFRCFSGRRLTNAIRVLPVDDRHFSIGELDRLIVCRLIRGGRVFLLAFRCHPILRDCSVTAFTLCGNLPLT